MKSACCIGLFTAIANFACAQALAPELAPIAAKYKSDLAALEAQRTAALAQAQAPYLAALGTAERMATTAGNVAGVSAIASERTALGSGLMSPSPPTGLPKELQIPRKTYLDASARIRALEAPRRQALDAAYLRALSNLVVKGAENPELAKQLEAEKQKLLASAPGAGGSKPSAKSAVVNGTFDIASADGHPGGWTNVEGFKVVRDGTNNVLHASAKEPGYVAITQDLLLPPRARSVTLSGRVRGKFLARDPNQGHFGANIAAVFIDSQDQTTKNWLMLDGGTDAKWKRLSVNQAIPSGMKVLQVVLVLKYVSGEFDFDDIEVEFR